MRIKTRVLGLALALALVLGNIPIGYADKILEISVDEWYYPYYKQITVGSTVVSDKYISNLNAYKNVTGVLFWAIMLHSLGLSVDAQYLVKESSVLPYMLSCYNIEIDPGMDLTKEITRSEAAHFIVKILKTVVEFDERTLDYSRLQSIIDIDNIEKSKYADDIKYIIAAGIMCGNGDGKFLPFEKLTVAQTCVVASRVLASVTPNYYDEIKDIEIKPTNLDGTAFPTDEIQAALNGETDDNISYNRMVHLINDTIYKPLTSYSNLTKTATIRDFLNVLYIHSNGHFILPNIQDGFTYPAEDSGWMSKEEWKAMIDNLDNNIMLGTVKVILHRSKEYIKEAMEYNSALTFDDYRNKVSRLVPEFTGIVDDSRDAVNFWINSNSTEGVSKITTSSEFFDTLHELQHEVSAKKSHVFQKRNITESSLQIVMSDKPRTFYYYNPAIKDWASIPSLGNLTSSKKLLDDLPNEVRTMSNYTHYIDADNTAANIWGIQGILMEFSSYLIDIRSKTVVNSFLARGDYLKTEASNLHNSVTDYLFWRAYTLSYLASLEEKYPSEYDKIMKNYDLLKLIVDLIEYGNKQLNYNGYFYKDVNTYKIYYDWCNTDENKAQLKKVYAALEQLKEKESADKEHEINMVDYNAVENSVENVEN